MAIRHSWFLGCLGTCWFYRNPRVAENTGVHSGATTLTSSKKEKKKKKDIPCWSPSGNETHPLSRIRKTPYLVIFRLFSAFSFAPYVTTGATHEAHSSENWTVTLYISSALVKNLAKRKPRAFLVFFIFVEQHSHIFPDVEPEFSEQNEGKMKKNRRDKREMCSSFASFDLREDKVPWSSFTGKKKKS